MKALQTRNIGMKPDASGHPLAPMEIVYEVDGPKRGDFLLRLWRLSLAKKLTLVMCAGSVWMLARPFLALLG